jgi:phosphoribosylanthranilate isomerase
MAEIDRYHSSLQPPLGILVDGYSEEFAGGTGARADWRLAAEIGATVPIILAGGLDPDNVGAAIRQVHPLGVDVSSGVEIDGVKDASRIEAFVRAARKAFQE